MKTKVLLGLFALCSVLSTRNLRSDTPSHCDNIWNLVDNDPSMKHHAYNELAYLSDTFGPRLWGSPSLDRATAHIYDYMVANGFEVSLEPVRNTPIWKRGKESLHLFSPRPEGLPAKLNLIGLGVGVAGNVRAKAIVFSSMKELEDVDVEKVKGKIVVVCEPWENYVKNVVARTYGPVLASKKGAMGYLTRSVASSSIDSPHTGRVQWPEGTTGIPAAAISVETAEMLLRMFKRGDNIELGLSIEAKLETYTKTTYNIIGEIKGTEKPNEVILLGGHTDSWDTGSQTGANDDGGGFMTCLQAVRAIIKLGIQPKRTIRFVGFAGEEFGDQKYSGFAAYFNQHKNDEAYEIVAFESDLGSKAFKGLGVNISKTPKIENAKKFFEESTQQIRNDKAYQIKFIDDFTMVDIEPLFEIGVPATYNLVDEGEALPYEYPSYFRYHHSAGDSMTMMDPDDMDSNVKGIACFMLAFSEY